MSKLLIALIFIPFSFANTQWNDLEGCYITREVNGKKLKLVPYWNDGSQSFKKDKEITSKLIYRKM